MSTLGEHLQIRPEYGINAAARPFDDRLVPYLRITDITDEGRFKPDPLTSVDLAGQTRYLMGEGDLVFARTGASTGKSYLYDPADGPLAFAGFLIRVRTNPQTLLPEYLALVARSRRYWSWVEQVSMRSGQPGINGREYESMPLHVPPVSEQRAIVASVGDTDRLLVALDTLIAKKRAIKEALATSLVEGHTRLPGFDADWTPRELGCLGQFLKGTGIRKTDVVSEGLPCVRYGELYTTHHNWIREFTSHIDEHTAGQALRLQQGDLLFAASGETSTEIGKSAAFLQDAEAYAGGDIIVLRSPDQDPRYLGYALNGRHVASQLARLGQGDAVVHISTRNLAQVCVDLPERKEQEAIGEVLGEVDAEIDALLDRRSKTALVREAMSEELLTGRTRVG